MNMFTTYPADAIPTKNCLKILIACAPSTNFGILDFKETVEPVENGIQKPSRPSTFQTLEETFQTLDKIFPFSKKFNAAKDTINSAKDTIQSGQACHAETAIKGWDWLFSKLALGGYAIPGWLIAIVAVLVARYFAPTLVLVGVIFAIALIQCTQEADHALRQGMSYFYSDIDLGKFTIPGWAVAAVAAYTALSFSGTILDSALIGVACWIMYSVCTKKSAKQIVKDVRNSCKSDGDAKSVVNLTKEYVVKHGKQAFDAAKDTGAGRRLSEFTTSVQETEVYTQATTAARRMTDYTVEAAQKCPYMNDLINKAKEVFEEDEELGALESLVRATLDVGAPNGKLYPIREEDEETRTSSDGTD